MRKRRINLKSFSRFKSLFFGRHVFKRAHIVQPVGKFYQNNADIFCHCKKHFAQRFYLLLFLVCKLDFVKLCYAFDKHGNIVAETRRNLRIVAFCIFYNVMQKPCRNSFGIKLHIRKNISHLQRMADIRLARLPFLVSVHLPGIFIGFFNKLCIRVRIY